MLNNFIQYEYKPYHKIYSHQLSNNSLYLGDVSAALDFQFIRNQSIKCVVTAAIGMDQVNYEKQSNNLKIKHIIYPLLDSKSQNIAKFFNQFYQLIENQIQNGNILVHCAAGISRSATLVISYLMKKYQWGFKQAVKFVRQKRPVILPNLGFQIQLKQYETAIKRQSVTSDFDRKLKIKTSHIRKYGRQENNVQHLPDLKALGPNTFIMKKNTQKKLKANIDLEYNKLDMKTNKSEHDSNLLKKKHFYLGNFSKDQTIKHLQSARSKILQRSNHLIDINKDNNQIFLFKSISHQRNNLKNNSQNKNITPLSHRCIHPSQGSKIKRKKTIKNRKIKQIIMFEQLSQVFNQKLKINEKKIKTEKIIRSRGLQRLAQL